MSWSPSAGRTIVCTEVFDENSQPSEEEVRDYAARIGIDVSSEQHLLHLARDGLMRALPSGWKPCFDEDLQAWYYFNFRTGESRWEHPLDDVYRSLVRKGRSESLSSSLGDEDGTASIDVDRMPPPPPSVPVDGKGRAALPQEKHPRNLGQALTLTGGGSIFLKSRGILRKQEEPEDNRKSVRFNILDVRLQQGGGESATPPEEEEEEERTTPPETREEDEEEEEEEEESPRPKSPKNEGPPSPKAPEKEEEPQRLKSPEKEEEPQSPKAPEKEEEKPQSPKSPGEEEDMSPPSPEQEEQERVLEVEVPPPQTDTFSESSECESSSRSEEKEAEAEEEEEEKEETSAAAPAAALEEEEAPRAEEDRPPSSEAATSSEAAAASSPSSQRQAGADETSTVAARLREAEAAGEARLAALEAELARREAAVRAEAEARLAALRAELAAEAEAVEETRRLLRRELAEQTAALERCRREHEAALGALRETQGAALRALREQEQRRRLEAEDCQRGYEKLRCEKRLLEDKYRSLKEKYLRLYTDVKVSIEKRKRRDADHRKGADNGNDASPAAAPAADGGDANNNGDPVENLRRQLRSLEDLEEQFPASPLTHADTYLRYPFADLSPGAAAASGGGAAELEFFRHRIHLERDSVRRAKDFLRAQRDSFQARRSELRQRERSSARSVLDQLYKEERELTDMEVSLHRTKSLLGEKIIRLRHLEQSLQRAAPNGNGGGAASATLSDVSSHSGSSGFSSSATAPDWRRHYREPTEIVHSLETLNTEIRDIWQVLHRRRKDQGVGTGVPPPWPAPQLQDRSLVERTRSLRDWLRQARMDSPAAPHASAASKAL